MSLSLKLNLRNIRDRALSYRMDLCRPGSSTNNIGHLRISLNKEAVPDPSLGLLGRGMKVGMADALSSKPRKPMMNP